MIMEYSNEVRGKVHAYRFEDFEMTAIAKSLAPEIRKRERKIQRIQDDPKNDGQATYAGKIDELRYEIEALEEIIRVFSPSKL